MILWFYDSSTSVGRLSQTLFTKREVRKRQPVWRVTRTKIFYFHIVLRIWLSWWQWCYSLACSCQVCFSGSGQWEKSAAVEIKVLISEEWRNLHFLPSLTSIVLILPKMWFCRRLKSNKQTEITSAFIIWSFRVPKLCTPWCGSAHS